MLLLITLKMGGGHTLLSPRFISHPVSEPPTWGRVSPGFSSVHASLQSGGAGGQEECPLPFHGGTSDTPPWKSGSCISL